MYRLSYIICEFWMLIGYENVQELTMCMTQQFIWPLRRRNYSGSTQLNQYALLILKNILFTLFQFGEPSFVAQAGFLGHVETAKHPVKKGDWDDVSKDIVIFTSHCKNKVAGDKKGL